VALCVDAHQSGANLQKLLASSIFVRKHLDGLLLKIICAYWFALTERDLKKQKPDRHFLNGSPAVFKRSVTFRPPISQGLAFSVFIFNNKREYVKCFLIRLTS
jgi:hypothetical protein